MENEKAAYSKPLGKRLWFGLFAPGTAWFIHLVATYVLSPWICAAGGRAFLIGSSALLAAIAAGAGIVSWSLWKGLELTERENILQTMEGSRFSFLVLAGMVFSGIFLLAIILQTIPVFIIDPC